MTTDPISEFTALVAAEVEVLGKSRAELVHDPYRRPARWVAQAVVDAVHRGDVVIRAHVCPKPENAGVAYEGPLTLTIDGLQRHVHAYWTKPKTENARMFVQEATVSVAIAARLVRDFGHDRSVVHVEADGGGVDVVVFDYPGLGGRLLLGAEAKVSDGELKAMVAGMRECGGVGGTDAHARGIAKVPRLAAFASRLGNHHKKCEWLSRVRPVAFWAVSPGMPDGMVFFAVPEGDGFSLKEASLADLHQARLAAALWEIPAAKR